MLSMSGATRPALVLSNLRLSKLGGALRFLALNGIKKSPTSFDASLCLSQWFA